MIRNVAKVSNFRWVLIMLALMWLVHIVGSVIPVPTHVLGLVPQSTSHLLSVVTYPFLHGDWQHLIGNTLGLLISGYLASQLPCFKRSTVVIFLLTGILVWLFASHAIHVGASGIVMGYFGFIMGSAIFRRNLWSFFIALVLLAVTQYFQINLLGTLFSFGENISASSHLFGFISGGVAAYLFKNKGVSYEKSRVR